MKGWKLMKCAWGESCVLGRESEGAVWVFYSSQFCNWSCLVARDLELCFQVADPPSERWSRTRKTLSWRDAEVMAVNTWDGFILWPHTCAPQATASAPLPCGVPHLLPQAVPIFWLSPWPVLFSHPVFPPVLASSWCQPGICHRGADLTTLSPPMHKRLLLLESPPQPESLFRK